jgi:hypothetical protein
LAVHSGRPLAELAALTETQQIFLEYWIRKEQATSEDRYWEKFGRQMGTTWYRSDFAETTKAEGTAKSDPDRVFYPHSALVSSSPVWTNIKKDFEGRSSKGSVAGGEYKATKGEEIIQTGDMSYEEFMAWKKDFEGG